MPQIVIICAMPPEIQPFRAAMPCEPDAASPVFPCWQGETAGQRVTLVEAGIGKVNAAAAAQFAITQYQPDVILSCGTAGGLTPHCQPGDVVIGATTAQQDYGFVGPDSFVPCGLSLRDETGQRAFYRDFPADADLLAAARVVAQTWHGDFRVQTGKIVTGDQIIFAATKRQTLAAEFGADAVEMESAALAQVCLLYEVPFLSIRGISDDASEASWPFDVTRLDPNTFGAFASASAAEKLQLLSHALRYYASHPTAFVLSVQARQRMKMASQHAAQIVFALLQHI